MTREDTRRLLVSPPGRSAHRGAREAVPVTPPGLQVRGVLGVDGDTVLFQASAEPTEIELWTYGPGGLSRVGAGRRRRGGRPRGRYHGHLAAAGWTPTA